MGRRESATCDLRPATLESSHLLPVGRGIVHYSAQVPMYPSIEYQGLGIAGIWMGEKMVNQLHRRLDCVRSSCLELL